MKSGNLMMDARCDIYRQESPHPIGFRALLQTGGGWVGYALLNALHHYT